MKLFPTDSKAILWEKPKLNSILKLISYPLVFRKTNQKSINFFIAQNEKNLKETVQIEAVKAE